MGYLSVMDYNSNILNRCSLNRVVKEVRNLGHKKTLKLCRALGLKINFAKVGKYSRTIQIYTKNGKAYELKPNGDLYIDMSHRGGSWSNKFPDKALPFIYLGNYQYKLKY